MGESVFLGVTWYGMIHSVSVGGCGCAWGWVRREYFLPFREGLKKNEFAGIVGSFLWGLGVVVC